MIDFGATFIYFFAVIDPIGTVPVFIAVTNGQERETRRRVAINAAVIAGVVLLLFVLVGEIILNTMGIPLSAFEIAGGIVLFLFALTMIFGESKPEEEVKLVPKAPETAVFPLAIPSIASPGAMLAAVLLTENRRYSFWEQSQTTFVMLSVLVVAFILMLSASSIQRWIGDSGASIISRVMGLILAAAATEKILAGIKTYFDL